MNFDLNSQARHELGSHLIEVVNNYFGSLPDLLSGARISVCADLRLST